MIQCVKNKQTWKALRANVWSDWTNTTLSFVWLYINDNILINYMYYVNFISILLPILYSLPAPTCYMLDPYGKSEKIFMQCFCFANTNLPVRECREHYYHHFGWKYVLGALQCRLNGREHFIFARPQLSEIMHLLYSLYKCIHLWFTVLTAYLINILRRSFNLSKAP